LKACEEKPPGLIVPENVSVVWIGLGLVVELFLLQAETAVRLQTRPTRRSEVVRRVIETSPSTGCGQTGRRPVTLIIDGPAILMAGSPPGGVE